MPIEITNKLGSETVVSTYSYNEIGLQTSKTENGKQTDYAYDTLNRLSEIVENDGRRTNYSYNKNGDRAHQIVELSGEVISEIDYFYNELGRLVKTVEERTESREETDYSYDRNGNQEKVHVTTTPKNTSLNVPNGESFGNVRNAVTNYTFNGRNQLVKSETAGGIAAEYKYYFNSLRSEKGNTRYIYDGKNVLAEVTFEDAEIVPPTVEGGTEIGGTGGTRQSETGGTGGEPTPGGEVSPTSPGGEGSPTSPGEATGRTAGGTTGESANEPTPGGESSPTSPGRTSETANEPTTSGEVSPTAPGGQALSGASQVRPGGTKGETAVIAGGTAGSESTPDAETLKKETGLTLNVYGGSLLFSVVATNSNGTTSEGGTAENGNAETTNLIYTFNAHGDVTRVSDENGVKLNSYDYDAFGNITEKVEAVQNTFFYSGYEYDQETGLYYLRTRYYDPKIARFISEDTFPGWYTDPLSLNKYTYTHNNPVSYHDPDGMSILGDMWNGAKKAASTATKWVKEKIVKPVKKLFTPKKESSSSSVGQNTSTTKKYAPTSSGKRQTPKPSSYLTGSSGSSSSTTGYNGISAKVREGNLKEIAPLAGEDFSKGFEAAGDAVGNFLMDNYVGRGYIGIFGSTSTTKVGGKIDSQGSSYVDILGSGALSVSAGDLTKTDSYKGFFNAHTELQYEMINGVETKVGDSTTLSIGKIVGIKTSYLNDNAGIAVNLLGVSLSVNVGKDGLQIKGSVNSADGDNSYENHIGLGLSSRGLDVNYGNGYYTKNTYSETEQRHSLNYGGIIAAVVIAAVINFAPGLIPVAGAAIAKNPQLLPGFG